ncbi:MAG: hypothetical protein AAFV53_28110 [Myxococcota bacterium]
MHQTWMWMWLCVGALLTGCDEEQEPVDTEPEGCATSTLILDAEFPDIGPGEPLPYFGQALYQTLTCESADNCVEDPTGKLSRDTSGTIIEFSGDILRVIYPSIVAADPDCAEGYTMYVEAPCADWFKGVQIEGMSLADEWMIEQPQTAGIFREPQIVTTGITPDDNDVVTLNCGGGGPELFAMTIIADQPVFLEEEDGGGLPEDE